MICAKCNYFNWNSEERKIYSNCSSAPIQFCEYICRATRPLYWFGARTFHLVLDRFVLPYLLRYFCSFFFTAVVLKRATEYAMANNKLMCTYFSDGYTLKIISVGILCDVCQRRRSRCYGAAHSVNSQSVVHTIFWVSSKKKQKLLLDCL